MDIKAYISSGIVEAYVMGTASEEEVRIFECVQKHSPEVRQAVLDAQSTLEDFVTSQAIAPPAELKSVIWAKVKQEADEPSDVKDTAAAVTVPLYPSQVVEHNNSRLKWLTIAAAVLLVASISLNFYLNGRQNRIKGELAALQASKTKDDLNYSNLKSRWDMVNNPAMKSIHLLGVEKHPDMRAVVYFDQTSKQVYLALENLPKTSKDHQYQLWAIVDGKPVSLGVYDQDAGTAVQKMTAVKTAQAFAITLEKRGGSPSPTLEQMYVMGKV